MKHSRHIFDKIQWPYEKRSQYGQTIFTFVRNLFFLPVWKRFWFAVRVICLSSLGVVTLGRPGLGRSATSFVRWYLSLKRVIVDFATPKRRAIPAAFCPGMSRRPIICALWKLVNLGIIIFINHDQPRFKMLSVICFQTTKISRVYGMGASLESTEPWQCAPYTLLGHQLFLYFAIVA